jgi:hypothetical protein
MRITTFTRLAAKISLSLIILLVLASAILAQEPAPTPKPPVTASLEGDGLFTWSEQTLQYVLDGPDIINGQAALKILKGIGTYSALDFYLDGTGRAMRFFAPLSTHPTTYFGDSGAMYTCAWVIISGTKADEDNDNFRVIPPSTDPTMLGIWSDVGGPAVEIRGSLAPNSHLLSGMDPEGNKTFAVEHDGTLRWGTSTRDNLDTALGRVGPNKLRTSGSFEAKSFSLGGQVTWTKGVGAPSGACLSGSLYSRTDEGPGHLFFVCERGVWVGK